MFCRDCVQTILARLDEPRQKIQVIVGARQVGKTTAVTQVCDVLSQKKIPYLMCFADRAFPASLTWVDTQWAQARQLLKNESLKEVVLIIDEIQKIADWSHTVKANWDEDTFHRTPIKVLLLGSSRALLEKGLSESMAGRYEVIRMAHWSYQEMHEAFGVMLEDYLYFGGYPGAVPFYSDEERFFDYIQGSIIDATINRDILIDTAIGKPAILRRLMELGCYYSTKELALTKVLGQLQDKGNAAALAQYLNLLSESGLISGLYKIAHDGVRKRNSVPKFQVFNNALLSAIQHHGREKVREDHALWGRYVESAIGAHLLNEAFVHRGELMYWRKGSDEVDFVYAIHNHLYAIEVKSASENSGPGLAAFLKNFPHAQTLLVGPSGIALETFFAMDLSE